ncbi:MAG: peroxidase [Nitrospira sp. WS110]|nr:peroxidase [Nitrospira sp. WS110]
MPRIQPLDPEAAHPKAAELLTGIHRQLGVMPNIFRTLAHAPAALSAYLNFAKSLGSGTLSAATREQIALAVAGTNRCGYCASAHTAMARQTGVSAEELGRNLNAKSEDPRTQAVLTFVNRIVSSRGNVTDTDLAQVRAAGLSDGEVVEIIANIAVNIFTNYLNLVASTEVDFPVVDVGQPRAA